MKRSIMITGMLLIGSVLSGCYGGESKGVDEAEGTGTANEKNSQQVLNLAEGGDLPTLNTLGLFDTLSSKTMNNIFEGLYRLDKSHEPVAGVAEKHEVSKDGKTYTFHLRSDAKWSNGTAVTAQDFEYAWKKAIHPDTLSMYAYLFNDMKNAAAIQDSKSELYGKVDELGIQAVDEHTLQVELENPVPYFLSLVTYPVFYPQNKEFTEKQGEKYALEAENLLYNGPFVLKSWEHEAGWIYEKNPDYWDADAVKLEKINVKVVKDVATRVNLYNTGQIDSTDLTSEFVDQYKDSPEYSTLLKPEVFFIRMNQKNKNLSNVNIRKAIDMGWDKKGAAEKLLNNGSIPAHYLVPKDFTFDEGKKDFRAKYEGFNTEGVEKAQEHWQKGLKELGVKNLKLELLSYDSEDRKKISEYVKNQLEKNLPGLTVNINQQPNKQKLALESSLQYDLSYSGWTPDFQDPITFIDLYVSDGPYNWSNFSNKKFDQLVMKAKADPSDLKERWRNLQEAEKILIEEEAAISPMYQSGSAQLRKQYVKGYIAHPFGVGASYKWVEIKGKN
ncbi:peptide ABC transporter substrate-binding protein [Bacillus badius]|nr:peptide ABC transporter substrate-binding protein [Bacillus badius]KZN98204.1 peptide ABC transporter substrate-binding protein [Bacillus badius]KZR58490.1 peptide ABC transporter substrate-binding protein [Bacillus badius]MED0666689.1 peptide ABC transporter substrate-binding protein [Bacillus badius]OCS82527.1 peptide ABC transporter substrate-binding protein [Bacillus badius]OVE50813.1 peptide ABC transporter substrate-binding protein [Bacillus badius]